MARDTQACASASYELVPSISQYKFNNLFIIYLSYYLIDLSVLST